MHDWVCMLQRATPTFWSDVESWDSCYNTGMFKHRAKPRRYPLQACMTLQCLYPVRLRVAAQRCWWTKSWLATTLASRNCHWSGSRLREWRAEQRRLALLGRKESNVSQTGRGALWARALRPCGALILCKMILRRVLRSDTCTKQDSSQDEEVV